MTQHTLLGAAALAAALATSPACGDDKVPMKDPATRTVDDVFAQLDAAGVAASGIAPVDGAALGGGACKRGSVDGIEVTACRYDDEGKARAAQPTGRAAVGEATGSALTSGPVLLVVADRAGKDPAGKKINVITRTFLQKAAGEPEPASPFAVKPSSPAATPAATK